MIVYLHGFNSSGDSAKGRFLEERLAPLKVLRPTYSIDPAEAMRQLRALMIDVCTGSKRRPILVGSSLGGFYAQHLAMEFGADIAMINPALSPASLLHNYLGWQENYYTGERYKLTERHLNQLQAMEIPEPCPIKLRPLLLLDEADEIIPPAMAIQRYAACADVHVFPGGNHAFLHMPEAVELLRERLDKQD